MSLRILPSNTPDLLKILGFLKDSQIPFVIAQEDVEPLQALLKDHDMSEFATLLSNTPLEHLCLPPRTSRKLWIPQSDFKHFCGSEWLIRGAYLTEEIFLDRILKYKQVNGLEQGAYLCLDDCLKQLFQTDLELMSTTMLLGFFPKVVKGEAPASANSFRNTE